MGNKQSKDSRMQRHGIVKKTVGTRFTTTGTGGGLSTNSGGQHSFLTIAPAGDDDSLGGLDDNRNMFVVPRRASNICGVFIQALVIIGPIDDPVQRDLGIYELYNYDNPEERMWAYIALPEISKKSARESFATMLDVLFKVSQATQQDQENNNYPVCVVAGRLKRLYFGTENFQQGEHDPEWKGRLAMIVSLPSNGIFLSALLALSPNGTVPMWLALVVGLGLVNALSSLHSMGYIHRYVTPWNFLLHTPFSVESILEKIIIIDFSLATKWPTKKTKTVNPFVGTLKYSSKRVMSRHKPGPADDLISVIFIVAELLSGKLPWRSVKNFEANTEMKHQFTSTPQFKRLPREIRVIYKELYRTYGMQKKTSAVITAFEKALDRKAPGWNSTYELPDYLTMPLESLE